MSRLRSKKSTITLICAAVILATNVFAVTTSTRVNLSQDEAQLFTKCWEYSASPDISVGAAADADRLYFVNADRKLEAVDTRNGIKLWSSEIGGDVIANLLASDTSILVLTRAGEAEKAVLRSLSKQTGVTSWSATVSTTRATLGSLNGNILIVGATGSINALNPTDGSQLWHTQIGSEIVGEPHFRSLTVTLATGKKELIDVAIGGQTSVRLKTNYLPAALLIERDDKYLIGDDRGNLVFTGADGDRRWRLKNGARISALLSYESEFLVASFDNFLYKLSRGGNVEWKLRLTGRVSGKPVVSGDTAALSIVGDGSVYFVNLNDGKITNRILVGDENSGASVAAAGTSIAVSGPRGISLYARGTCPPNK